MHKTPLWQAIACELRGEIADRIYAPGDRLATEAELARRFGVNRHTVRRALGALVDEKLVRTRRGSGSFVTSAPTDYPIGTHVRFHQNILATGQTPEKRVLQILERPANAAESRYLEIEPGAALCVYHGISLADDTPIALFNSHFPADRLPGIARALAEERGVTDALRRCGIGAFERVSTRISARTATATQALHIHVAEGAPLLHTVGLNAAPDGIPVEYGLTWFAGDRVTLTTGDC